MATVRVSRNFPGTVPEAERCWYDTARWPRWVDGLERVVSVAPGWPSVGGRVEWESGPAGRGRVSERVIAYEPLAAQTVAVADPTLEGEQTVTFNPADGGVDVSLALSYRPRRPGPLMALIDLLFIRRAMAASLATTLDRFGTELAAQTRPPA